jgi:hypothetical protein
MTAHRYAQNDGPTSADGLREVFAAGAPPGLTADASERLFNSWVQELRGYVAQTWRIHWYVLSGVAVADMQLPPESIRARLEAAITAVPIVRPHSALEHPQ